jgi:hypothetical protein
MVKFEQRPALDDVFEAERPCLLKTPPKLSLREPRESGKPAVARGSQKPADSARKASALQRFRSISLSPRGRTPSKTAPSSPKTPKAQRHTTLSYQTKPIRLLNSAFVDGINEESRSPQRQLRNSAADIASPKTQPNSPRNLPSTGTKVDRLTDEVRRLNEKVRQLEEEVRSLKMQLQLTVVVAQAARRGSSAPTSPRARAPAEGDQ